MRKHITIVLALLMTISILPLFAQGGQEATSTTNNETQEVYFLNNKPEVALVYTEKVVPAFEKENPGYTLKVVTAASGTYPQT